MEYLDIINDNDKVIGQATREEIYQKKLMHRIVHLIILDNNGRFALQLRSKNVKFCPNHWSTIVGGHVQSGETYKEAILREAEEEIGIKPIIKKFSKDLYAKDGLKKFLVTFKTHYNGSFKPNSEDVETIKFFKLDEIKKMVTRGEKFHPELLFLLENYFLN